MSVVRAWNTRRRLREQEQQRQQMIREMHLRGAMGMGAGSFPGTPSGGIVMDDMNERARLIRAQAQASQPQLPPVEPSDFGGTTTGPNIGRWLRDGRP